MLWERGLGRHNTAAPGSAELAVPPRRCSMPCRAPHTTAARLGKGALSRSAGEGLGRFDSGAAENKLTFLRVAQHRDLSTDVAGRQPRRGRPSTVGTLHTVAHAACALQYADPPPVVFCAAAIITPRGRMPSCSSTCAGHGASPRLCFLETSPRCAPKRASLPP